MDNFEPPESWETFTAKRGQGLKSGGGIAPRHFLRDAVANHLDEYQGIFEKELHKL